MSSTNRGSARLADDHYETPAWAVHRILEALPPEFPRNGVWLEPCAGTGAIIRATHLKPEIVKPTKWLAVDLSRNASEIDFTSLEGTKVSWKQGDFLDPWDGEKVDVVFTNPPYSLAQEFVEQSLKVASHVVMLLRLNFLASGKRSTFMRTTAPDVYVLPNRPSFTTDGHTDSIEYAWFVWGPNRMRRVGNVAVLGTTPKGERGRATRQEPTDQMAESSPSDQPS
jgi:predicted RNA methylase